MTSNSQLTSSEEPKKKKWKVCRDGPTVCSNCATTLTPIWRRSPEGALLCNACGLHLRIHKESRPKESIESLEVRQQKKNQQQQHKATPTLPRKSKRSRLVGQLSNEVDERTSSTTPERSSSSSSPTFTTVAVDASSDPVVEIFGVNNSFESSQDAV